MSGNARSKIRTTFSNMLEERPPTIIHAKTQSEDVIATRGGYAQLILEEMVNKPIKYNKLAFKDVVQVIECSSDEINRMRRAINPPLQQLVHVHTTKCRWEIDFKTEGGFKMYFSDTVKHLVDNFNCWNNPGVPLLLIQNLAFSFVMYEYSMIKSHIELQGDQ
jgi:hypothetical protein